MYAKRQTLRLLLKQVRRKSVLSTAGQTGQKRDPQAYDQKWYDMHDAVWSTFDEPYRTDARDDGKKKQLAYEARMAEQEREAQKTQKAMAKVKCKECNKKTPIEIVPPGEVSSSCHLI